MQKSDRLYFVAGEASGDLHGGNLVRALRTCQPDLQMRGWGGDDMESAGVEIVKHYRDLAFMGFVEVVRNLPTILANFRVIKADILAFRPDALILIDYPGFNLRLAKWAKKQGIPVIYYISPQIWAWHASRAHQIKRNVDLMLTILPFEQAFYAQYGMPVDYVGHPLLDALVVPEANQVREKILLLLPGSRTQEVRKLLPEMAKAAIQFPDYQCIVAGVKTVDSLVYMEALSGIGASVQILVVYDQTHDLMRRASFGLIKSGTSTLEAALHRLPQVVCYKASPISFAIAKRVIRVPYISLVNLILDRQLVPELIQNQCTAQTMVVTLSQLDEKKIQSGYSELISALGDSGASSRAAFAIRQLLSTLKSS
jgi:lipid-A-disaccharide synthase